MVGSGYIYVSVWSIKLCWLDQDISMYLYGELNYGWIRIYLCICIGYIELWLVGSKYMSKGGLLNCGIIMKGQNQWMQKRQNIFY